MKKLKKIPEFSNGEEEMDFWATHDSTDYIDWTKADKTIFPNLKPSSETISLRLPENLLNELKIMANKRDIPYQSLMKVILADAVERESSTYHPIPRETNYMVMDVSKSKYRAVRKVKRVK